MSGKNARLTRIEGELQRVVAELIAREVKDPRVGHSTITAVSVAPDLSVARICFVPFGAEHTPEEVGAGLDRAAGFLRSQVARRLSLRHAPRLEFRYDESLEKANRLTSLIDSAVRGDRGAATAWKDDDQG